MSNMTIKTYNNIDIPLVGFGSFLATEGKGKQNIIDALRVGYNYIDTAYFYKNEEQIGEAIRDFGIDRKDLFLCSKVWPTMMGYEGTLDSFAKSTEMLGTDYLDMYLIHWPKKSMDDQNWKEYLQQTWKAMEELYNAGKVRVIGLSNFLPHHIRAILETAQIKPMLNQLELHVGYMQYEAVEYSKSMGMVVQAWSPLGRARVIKDESVALLAEKYRRTPAQILLRFLVQQDIAVIPKASSVERMKENMDIFDFEIEEDDMSFLKCLPQRGYSGEHPDYLGQLLL